MIYLLCIVLPPAAVFLKGKPISALLNVLLTLLFWVPGIIHAILVVNAANADARTKRLVNAVRQQKRAPEYPSAWVPPSNGDGTA